MGMDEKEGGGEDKGWTDYLDSQRTESEGISRGERPRLRFKERAPQERVSLAPPSEFIPERFREPQPPSLLQRLGSGLRRFAWVLLPGAAGLALLAVPFERWDRDASWREIEATLAHLEASPAAPDALRQFHQTAEDLGLLATRPSGPYPGRWHQAHRRSLYRAEYGVALTLGFAGVVHSPTSAGAEILQRLRARTGDARVPGFPEAGFSRSHSIPCADCSGRGVCVQCRGEGKRRAPGLRGVRSTPVFLQPCPFCQGSGRCPACGGKGTVTESGNPDLVRRVYREALSETRRAVAQDRLRRQVLRWAALPRRQLLGK